MNADQATAPGRAALAGLSAISSPAGSPVWVFSPMLDTMGAADFNQLAFDESPPTVVQAATDAGQLPNLQGREVTFVVSPVAGEQKKLSDLQVGYQHAIWEGLATAGGASKVTFFDGTGTTPGTGTIPAIPVPDPNDKISAEAQGADPDLHPARARAVHPGHPQSDRQGCDADCTRGLLGHPGHHHQDHRRGAHRRGGRRRRRTAPPTCPPSGPPRLPHCCVSWAYRPKMSPRSLVTAPPSHWWNPHPTRQTGRW